MTQPSARRHISHNIQDLVFQPGTLGQLLQRSKQSQHCLRLIQPLLPSGLYQCLQAGPLDDNSWCLLATHNAAAAKVRQFLPALSAHLRSHGFAIQDIRVKVSSYQPER